MKYLVVDFEFSIKEGYGSPRAWFPEIIEVGTVMVDERGVPLHEPYGRFVKPRFWPRLAKECFGISGISQKDVDGGVPLEIALEKMLPVKGVEDLWLVAWGDSDRRVLAHNCEKYGLEYPFVYEQYVDLAESFCEYQSHKKLTSLKNAILMMDVDKFGIEHSAMDDAVNTALILQKMIKDGWNVGHRCFMT